MPIDEFLVSSFTTAVGEGELALEARFAVPDDRTAGSYQKIERKVGDFATAAAAVQVSLNADGTIREAGVALSAAGPCAVRVVEAERLLAGQKPSAALLKAAADAAARQSAPQADLRGSVAYKRKHGRRARRPRLAAGPVASGSAGMKVTITVNGDAWTRGRSSPARCWPTFCARNAG